FQIWAEPGASRGTGRWLSIMTTRCFQTSPSIAPDSTRLLIGGRRALISITSDGLTQLDIAAGSQPENNRNVQIVSRGLSVDEVTAIAATIQLDEPDASPNCTSAPPIRYAPAFDSLHDGLDSVVDTASADTAIGSPNAARWRTATYTNIYNSSTLTITTQPFDPATAAAARFELSASDDPDAPTSLDRSVQVAGRTVTVNSYPHAPGTQSETVLQWTDGTNLVSLTSDLTHDLPTLLRIATQSRLATPDEWSAFAATPTAQPDTSSDPSAEPPSTRVLVSDDSGDGKTWQLTQFGDGLLLLVGPDSNVVQPIDQDTDPSVPVMTLNTFSTTVLVVALPSTQPGDTVRVTFGTNGNTIETSMFGHDDDNGTEYALLVFDQIGTYSVALVHDGMLTRTLA
ncbi:MAG: hypothetical protein JWL72_975, partial [Ilumatobacteraceae bacterium]|nr:hypothetical protein [Ilumatobacteraceae bacterium]